MLSLERDGDFERARRVAEEILRLDPNAVRYHQKRVEYAFRSGDRSRLVDAYLELADCLFRAGDLEKARSVYTRVLDLSPADERAREALSAFTKPDDVARGTPASGMTPAHGLSGLTPPALLRALTFDLRTPGSTPPIPPRLTPLRGERSTNDSFVNLADWLRDDTPNSVGSIPGESEDGNEQADFAEMLSMFKQGVAAHVEDTDHQSHYDLGIAYKEMGLLDEAIAEFQKALRGTEGRVRTYEALGQCFVEKRQYQIGVTILSRALSDQSHTDDVLVGVLYFFAQALEALGKPRDAVAYYERVALSTQFRDAVERAAAIRRSSA